MLPKHNYLVIEADTKELWRNVELSNVLLSNFLLSNFSRAAREMLKVSDRLLEMADRANGLASSVNTGG
jgi:hypothetical protein